MMVNTILALKSGWIKVEPIFKEGTEIKNFIDMPNEETRELFIERIKISANYNN